MFDLVERGRETHGREREREREEVDQRKEEKGREVERKDNREHEKGGFETAQQSKQICQERHHLSFSELKWKVWMFHENLPALKRKLNCTDLNQYITQ